MKFRKHPMFSLLFVVLVLWGLMQTNATVYAAGTATIALTPVTYFTQVGNASGTVGALSLSDQSGTADTPSSYVTLKTPSTIYSGNIIFTLPANISPASVNTLQVKINYKGPTSSNQTWTWRLYDWKAKQWNIIGTNAGAKKDIWTNFSFNLTNPARFVDSAGKVTLQSVSGNASGDAKIDYAALQVGYINNATPTQTAQPPLTATPTAPALCATYNQAFETRVLELINQERAKVGLAALKAQSQLAAAARAHSADMGCNNYFSHTGLNGSTAASRIEKQGYKWSWVGENIAAGSNTPEGVMQQWMNSAPHKANILSPNYTDVGVGYAYSSTSTYKYYWTLDFAKP